MKKSGSKLTQSLLCVWLGFANEDFMMVVHVDCRYARDRQVRPQRPQSKVTPGTVAAEASRFFLLQRFSLRLFLRESSKEETAWWIIWRQVMRSAARVYHWRWSMWQAPRDFFRKSLYRFFGAPLLRWPVESSPYSAILGSR